MRTITKREQFGSFVMATIAVLGLDLDLTLRGIGEELKVRTHLNEPYVAKKMNLHAVRRQNEVILALQANILDMEKLEAGLQLTMNTMQKEVVVINYRACEAVVVPIIVQGQNKVRDIRVKAGIGRLY